MPNMPALDREHADTTEPQCEAGSPERPCYRRYKGSMARGQMPPLEILEGLTMRAQGLSLRASARISKTCFESLRRWWNRLYET
jgi:hypothetical protein